MNKLFLLLYKKPNTQRTSPTRSSNCPVASGPLRKPALSAHLRRSVSPRDRERLRAHSSRRKRTRPGRKASGARGGISKSREKASRSAPYRAARAASGSERIAFAGPRLVGDGLHNGGRRGYADSGSFFFLRRLSFLRDTRPAPRILRRLSRFIGRSTRRDLRTRALL